MGCGMGGGNSGRMGTGCWREAMAGKWHGMTKILVLNKPLFLPGITPSFSPNNGGGS